MNVVLVLILGVVILAIGIWSLSAMRRGGSSRDDDGDILPFTGMHLDDRPGHGDGGHGDGGHGDGGHGDGGHGDGGHGDGGGD